MHSSAKTLGSAYDSAATVVALLRNILTKNQGGSLVAGHGTLLCVSHRRTQTVSAARWFFDPIVLKVGSWSALALEFSLGVLIWVKEFRYVLLVLGVMFHLWLEYSLNVPLFQWDVLSAYILFVDPADLTGAWRRMRLFYFSTSSTPESSAVS